MNERGEQLLAVLEMGESEAAQLSPVTFALALAQGPDGFLLMLNSQRQVWELPGGRIDPGESFRQCAIRELHEESGQTLLKPRWRALLKLHNPGNDLCPEPHTEYGALFCGDLPLLAPFTKNEEASEIALWRPDALPPNVSAIDAHLLQLFR